MAISLPCYTTREKVKKATDIKASAFIDDLVDSSVSSASRNVERFCHRIFYPSYGTRVFDWPDRSIFSSYKLWLDDNELISVTNLISGGSTIDNSLFFLEPANSGPPFDMLQLNIGLASSSAAFLTGPSYQHSIAITGKWGYRDESTPGGSLLGTLSSSGTSITINNSNLIGVGDLISINDERLIVMDRFSSSIGDTLQTPLTPSVANDLVAVSNGTNFNKGEIITLDSERMLIVAINGNGLTVKRSYDGSTLAAHSGSTIYSDRGLTVIRGAVGSVAATHNVNALVTKYEPPAPIEELATAYAISTLLNKQSGYVSSSTRSSKSTGNSSKGSNPTGAGAAGGGIAGLEDQVRSNYRRKGRIFAV
jgi:hypothetical protein